MWLLVLPLGFCWNSPNHVTSLPPPSPSPSELRQKNPACSQKLSRLPSKWHISLPPPVPFALCHLPGQVLLRTGCPRGWYGGGAPLWVLAPRAPPPGCRRPGLTLAVGQNAQLCVPRAAEKEGRNQEECGIRPPSPCLSLPGSPQPREPASPVGEGERGADARSPHLTLPP